MFGIEEVVELIERGQEIYVSKLLKPFKFGYPIKGINHPEGKSVICMRNCENDFDYKETIIHELYHEYFPDKNETTVEETAHAIQIVYPEIADFVMETFELPDYTYKCFHRDIAQSEKDKYSGKYKGDLSELGGYIVQGCYVCDGFDYGCKKYTEDTNE